MTLANRIKEIRLDRGLTQEQLAKRAGITQQAVARLESRGIAGLRLTTARQIAKALETTVDRVFPLPVEV